MIRLTHGSASRDGIQDVANITLLLLEKQMGLSAMIHHGRFSYPVTCLSCMYRISSPQTNLGGYILFWAFDSRLKPSL